MNSDLHFDFLPENFTLDAELDPGVEPDPDYDTEDRLYRLRSPAGIPFFLRIEFDTYDHQTIIALREPKIRSRGDHLRQIRIEEGQILHQVRLRLAKRPGWKSALKALCSMVNGTEMTVRRGDLREFNQILTLIARIDGGDIRFQAAWKKERPKFVSNNELHIVIGDLISWYQPTSGVLNTGAVEKMIGRFVTVHAERTPSAHDFMAARKSISKFYEAAREDLGLSRRAIEIHLGTIASARKKVSEDA